MKARIVVSSVLFIFIAVSIAFFIGKERARMEWAGQAPRIAVSEAEAGDRESRNDGAEHEKRSTDAAERPAASSPANAVLIYYFHGTRRCATCRKIEEYTKEAVTNGFGEELRSGAIIWRTVNVEDPGNEHFIEDYRLSTKSVVLVKLVNGTEAGWTNLSRIWDLAGDRTAFTTYIEDEVRRFEREGS